MSYTDPCTIALQFQTMYDDLFSEIADAPGEIFDIPELRDLRDDNNDDDKFNVEEYINGNIDY